MIRINPWPLATRRSYLGPLVGLMAATAFMVLLAPARASLARPADFDCSCVEYVESMTAQMYPGQGLPGGPSTAAGYTESFMDSVGWYRVLPANTPTNNYIPADGAVMVWDADQKGACGPCGDNSHAGHMAIVQGNPWYNYVTGKWVIKVQHVDWAGNCGVGTDTFSDWGDLYGVNFYKPNGY